MNTMAPILCLKGTSGSKSATKLHWPSHKHSAHYAGSLSNTEWVLNWLGRTKCINWALCTNTGHACSVKMTLVKLDSEGFLMLFSICLHVWMWKVLSPQHRTSHSRGVTLDITDLWAAPWPRERAFLWCACVCARVCRHAHALGLLCEAFSL